MTKVYQKVWLLLKEPRIEETITIWNGLLIIDIKNKCVYMYKFYSVQDKTASDIHKSSRSSKHLTQKYNAHFPQWTFFLLHFPF